MKPTFGKVAGFVVGRTMARFGFQRADGIWSVVRVGFVCFELQIADCYTETDESSGERWMQSAFVIGFVWCSLPGDRLERVEIVFGKGAGFVVRWIMAWFGFQSANGTWAVVRVGFVWCCLTGDGLERVAE